MTRQPEWWETYFDDLYLREHSHIFNQRDERRFVSRVLELAGLPVGARVLDCPCGQGRHSMLFAEAGLDVSGVDLSRRLLALARRKSRTIAPTYRRADMRKLPSRWSASFDAIFNLFSSFGFFLDPSDDARVIAEFARVLRPGGILIWQGANRDNVPARFPAKDWWIATDGTLVAQSREFDYLSGVLTVQSEFRGRRLNRQHQHRIRLYTATRLSELLASVGLFVENALDGEKFTPLSRSSGTMLLLARKDF